MNGARKFEKKRLGMTNVLPKIVPKPRMSAEGVRRYVVLCGLFHVLHGISNDAAANAVPILVKCCSLIIPLFETLAVRGDLVPHVRWRHPTTASTSIPRALEA